MAKKFLVNIDLSGNQIQNAILASTRVKSDPAAFPPAVVGAGQLWYDSTNNQLNVYTGSAFVPLMTGTTAVASLNNFTGDVNIYGTENQVSVSNSSGSITLSLPSTISGVSANFNSASVSGSALATQSYVDSASVSYATNSGNSSTTSQTNFSALTISGSNVATESYVTSQGYVTSSGSVNYASNSGSLGGNAASWYAPVNSPSFTGTVNLGTNTATGSVSYATDSGNSSTTSQTNFSSLTISGSNVATEAYVSGASVAYATNAGNAATVTNGVYTTDTGTVTSTMIADGTIVDGDISASAAISVGKLSASNVTVGSTAIGLGETASAISGLTNLTSASLNITDSTDASGTSVAPFVVSGGAGIAKSVYIGGDLSISGSVFISGSAVTISSSNSVLNDSLLYLADNNPANLLDIGIVSSFDDGTYQHTGIVRDASDGKWKLFSGVVPEPDTTVNFASATYDILRTGGLEIYSDATTPTASITAAGSGNFSGLSISGSPVATQSYVTNASVAYATNSGNSSTTSQTDFSSLTLSGSNVATQAYVTSQGYLTSSGSIASASNSASLGGVAASAYAKLSSANFTAASVGGNAVATQSYVTSSGWSNSSASVGYATNAGNATTTSQTNFSSLTVGSVAVARKYSASIAGNDATASWTITHNLGTREVTAQVYQLSNGPDTQYAEVEVDIVRSTASAVVVTFATAPATGSNYQVVIVG